MLLARTDPTVRQARGHHLLRAADAPARRGGAAPAPDERALVVQRGVPHRRPRAGRQRGGHGRRGLDAPRSPRWPSSGASGMFGRPHYSTAVGPGARGGPQPRPTATSPPTPGTRSEPAASTSWCPGPRPPAGPATRCCASRSPGSCRSSRSPAGRRPGPGRAGPRAHPGSGGLDRQARSSLVARQAAAVHAAIAGADGMLTGPDSPEGGVIAEVLVSTPAQSIAGGHRRDPAQHPGERALGLPREPRP